MWKILFGSCLCSFAGNILKTLLQEDCDKVMFEVSNS